jgi:hypothetical protein
VEPGHRLAVEPGQVAGQQQDVVVEVVQGRAQPLEGPCPGLLVDVEAHVGERPVGRRLAADDGDLAARLGGEARGAHEQKLPTYLDERLVAPHAARLAASEDGRLHSQSGSSPSGLCSAQGQRSLR